MAKSLLEYIFLKLFIVQDPNKSVTQWYLQKNLFYRQRVKKSFSILATL